MKTHIEALYHCNITFSRRMKMYRLTLLMSRMIAPLKTIQKAGIEIGLDDEGIPRLFYTEDEVNALSRVVGIWMGKNEIGEEILQPVIRKVA